MPSSIARRSFLLGTGAAALGLAAGCASRSQPPASTATDPRATVASLTSDDPFYIAHRGGGRNWPQMTAYAYDQCTHLPGLQALEISVCLSQDGVLVANHSSNTKEATGVAMEIGKETWDRLGRLQVLPTSTIERGQPARPLSRADDIIRAHIDRFVLFVEPKVPAAAEPLMELLATLRQPERVVWKQPVNSDRFETAKSHGFTTWGYVLNEPAHTGHKLDYFAASDLVDMMGAPLFEPDPFGAAVVSAATRRGKKVIAWALNTTADRDRALAMGCVGLMTSNIVELFPG